MKIRLEADHWIEGIRRCPSPHFDDRPTPSEISLLVIHNISLPPGEFQGGHIEKLFCGTLSAEDHPYFQEIFQLKVAAHLLIDREGKMTQFVPFDKRAWHCGESQFEGRAQCNDFSIGIELEGSDDLPFESAQYDQLAEVTKTLLTHYPLITNQRITGHSDIAPGRKTDPGPHFEWDRFFKTLDP